MTTSPATDPTYRKPLRLWPGVAIVIVQWLAWVGIPAIAPDYAMFGLLGGVALGLAILIWWLFFSRAQWSERLGALVVIVIAVLLTTQVVHLSVSNGLMGRMPFIFTIPLWSLGLVVAAAIGRNLSAGPRRAVMVAAIVLACSALALVRTGGITGAGGSDLHWRWTPTPEERLIAQASQEPTGGVTAPATSPSAAPASTPAPVPAGRTPAEVEAKPSGSTARKTDERPTRAAATDDARPTTGVAAVDRVPDLPARAPEWPGFRGPARDSVVRGVRIEPDWSQKPPVELWRRPIGPGWSSFAVDGDLVYTQEQRGASEVVSCYRLSTGEPVWTHTDAARFYESNGGAGPRATPTVYGERVYTHGATGIVNALDARTGKRVWSRNAATDTGAPMPGWGFAGSPLVIGDAVVVAASGRLVAYDVKSGNPLWTRQTGGGGYSSPHLVTIDGVPQIVLLSRGWATSVAPRDGAVLWQHKWEEGVSIVQPAATEDGDLLIAAGDMMGGLGIRRIAVTQKTGGWTNSERWTSRGLKPYFNDYVVHKGHAFGFDGTILSCINLADGERKWKGGRYGAGQMLLLADQDLLLILSEDGELALVQATADKHTEVSRFKAIEGKTWNHPVLVGDVLLVRNGEEMAAFRLPLQGR